MVNDLQFQALSTVQSNLQPTPVSQAAAATISPSTLVTILSGTTQLATVNPPVSGSHMLVLIFTDASPGVFLTSGNIKKAFTPVINVPVLMFYEPVSGLYYAK